MRQTLTRCSLAMAVAAACAGAAAQALVEPTARPAAPSPAATPVAMLGLTQALEQALQGNPSIRASRAQLEGVVQRVEVARAGLLPQAQAVVGRNFNVLDTTANNALGVPSTTNSEYYSFNKTLSLRQPILNAQRLINFRQSKDYVSDAQATLRRDESDLTVKLVGAYLDVLQSQHQLALVKGQQRQLAATMQAASLAFRNGSGTRTDVDEARARLDLAQASVLEAEQAVEQNQRSLAALMNVEIASLGALPSLDATGWKALLQEVQPLEWWQEQVQANSPELASLQARLAAADKEVSKSKAAHAPTLDAVAAWSDSGNENVSRLNTRFVNTYYGVQLVVPLYAGGGTQAQVRQAQAERTRAEELLANLRLDVMLRLNREFHAIRQGQEKVLALEQALFSANEMVRSVTMSNKAGMRTVIDVLNAEQQRLQVLRDLSLARAQTLMSALRLRLLAGEAPQDGVVWMTRAFAPLPNP